MIEKALSTIAILAASFAIANVPISQTPHAAAAAPAVASLPAVDSAFPQPAVFPVHSPPLVEPVSVTVPEPDSPPAKPVARPAVQYRQPVYYQSYGSCGPGGCGPRGVFRGGLFGRRR